MQIQTALEHSDEASGTWIMNDGTKCHWTEGRSSSIVCVLPDGKTLDMEAARLDSYLEEEPQHADLITTLIEATENGPDTEEWRAMTPAEETEHKQARA